MSSDLGEMLPDLVLVDGFFVEGSAVPLQPVFVIGIVRVRKRIEEGDRKAGAEMLEYLAGWLQSHIPVTDRMMAAYLRNFERRRAA